MYQKLSECFGGFDHKAQNKALFSTIQLFRDAAQSVALSCGYTYPEELDTNIIAYIKALNL